MNSINKNQPEDTIENLGREEAVKKIKELIEQAETCFFCTEPASGPSGGVRPMTIQQVDDEGNLWVISANDSHDLEEMVDTNSEWIVARTGIKERRIVNDPDIATSDMATYALKRLMEEGNVNPDEIDCVIVSTSTPDYVMVSTGSMVCEKAGLKNA